MKKICVFCGSKSGINPAFTVAARKLGGALVQAGLGLVYGGGHVGLMGEVADAVLAAGGHVTGVIPQHLFDLEVGHTGLQDLRVVNSMHERKALMAELSVGFIAMPGGFGTFEEFCEIVTWRQLGLLHKPIGLLNVAGYYDHMIQMFDLGVREKFIHAGDRQLILHSSDSIDLLAQLKIN